jgi:hypothetical protein
MKTTRRQFLTTASTAAIGAGILIGTAACSDSEETTNGTGSGGGGTAGGCSDSAIVDNHGHSLSIPQGDVDAGAEKTYSIQGTSPHDHEVTVTAADFMTLAGGSTVQITATSDGTHDHLVTVSCA